MVFGQPERDQLQLNDVTNWSGGPAPDADRPEGYKALPEIRRLLREEKFPEAGRLMQQNMLQHVDYFPSYQASELCGVVHKDSCPTFL
jgi:alpha-L-fucosidase 2